MTQRDTIDREQSALEWERALIERRIGGNPYDAPERPVQAPETLPAGAEAYFDGRLEKDWQAKIVRAAHAAGWGVYHTYDSRRSMAGFPDLVLWHGGHGVIAFREIKTNTGKVAPAQEQLLLSLRFAGADVEVWRFPMDWDRAVAFLTNPEAE